MTAGTSSQFEGPLPGAARPAFSYLLLGALRGWGDRNHDGRVTATAAIAYADKVLASLPLGRSQRPQLLTRAPSTVLATHAGEAAPDLDAVMSGRVSRAQPSCPSGSRWNGRSCIATVACPEGARWDMQSHGCVAAVPCPAGTRFAAGRGCVGRNIKCDEGRSFIPGRGCVPVDPAGPGTAEAGPKPLQEGCSGGDARSCRRLGLRHERGRGGGDAGFGWGCAWLANKIARGKGAAEDRAAAAALSARACRPGYRKARKGSEQSSRQR